MEKILDKTEHPKKRQYYLLNNRIVQVIFITRIKEQVLEKISKTHWFQKQQYKDTGVSHEILHEVWWVYAGDPQIPGVDDMLSTKGAINYDWDKMHKQANKLIKQVKWILKNS